jgi:uncharacterized membrane protein (DUF2068 family)
MKHAGLRAVALLEAAKGVVVLLAGLGLFAVLHQGVQSFAEQLVRHAHLDPASHYPRVFLDLAARSGDTRLWELAAAALAYALLRFVEAYGLWRRRRWGLWVAALSGGLYVPIEVTELARHASPVGGAVLVVNLAIVGYMAVRLWKGKHG